MLSPAALAVLAAAALALWSGAVGLRVITETRSEPGTVDHCLAAHLPGARNALAAQAIGRACRDGTGGEATPYATCILSSLDGMRSRRDAAEAERACRRLDGRMDSRGRA